MKKLATSGNKGKGVRSDCFVSIEITDKGGLDIQLESKVKDMFGESTLKLTKEVFDYFEIKPCIAIKSHDVNEDAILLREKDMRDLMKLWEDVTSAP